MKDFALFMMHTCIKRITTHHGASWGSNIFSDMPELEEPAHSDQVTPVVYRVISICCSVVSSIIPISVLDNAHLFPLYVESFHLEFFIWEIYDFIKVYQTWPRKMKYIPTASCIRRI